MKRRVEDVPCRPEVASGIVGTATGPIGTHNQHFAITGTASGYVRVPTTAPGVQLQQGTRLGSTAGVALTVNASLPGVVPVPVTTISNTGGLHGPHEHQSISHSGSVGSKIEMHTNVHHSLPAYAASLPSNNLQGSISVDSGRPVVTVSGAGTLTSNQMPSGQNCLASALLHSNQTPHPSSQVRPRIGGSSSIHQSTAAAALGSGAAAMAAVAGGNQTTGQFQRLKVEDALSYLDQVKLRFGRHPQVYNDFLDIMKEFKSQSIDTPGVIARVSQLFRGHPELIVGFNTFLPPGYKIEVSVSVPGQQTTVVHTPQGIHHHVTQTHQSTPPPPPPQPPSVTVKTPQTSQHPAAPRTNLSGSVLSGGAIQPAVSTPAAISSSGIAAGNVVVASNAIGANTPSGGSGVLGSPNSVPVAVSVPVPAVSVNSVAAAPIVTVGSQGQSAPQNPLSAANNSQNVRGEGVATASREALATTPAASAAAASGPGPGPGHHHPSHLHQPTAQPVEFNHAINYVNKIKHRFQAQPDIYKQFLEILHTYQKEQKHIKEGGSIPTRTLTEAEVYEKVAKLFENQEDLLQEFGQFLPDATNNTAAQAAVSDFMDQCRSHSINKTVTNDNSVKKPTKTALVSGNNLVIAALGANDLPSAPAPPAPNNASASHYGSHSVKRPYASPAQPHGGSNSQPPVKKPKLSYLKDMSAAEAGKYATLSEYAFFDKVRKALRLEETYHNFLRCITLYNEEIISRSELLGLVHPFLMKFPDLLKWFKDFLGLIESPVSTNELIPSSIAKQERISGDLALEIDYTTCKRLGASYCALPKSHPQPECTGRSGLCKEVLNDTWVSFPSWSEDSTFVTSRKTQYEEYIYRCEDERFELDVVLETNLATIRVLESVQKKLQRMSPEEAARFKLDDSLGGSSPTIHQRSIKRIYGDKAADIVDGLKKNPMVAVPLVLRRLKAKDDEWREAQKGFNKIWREQNERYYLKSLDHQGLTFKQNDVKTLRSKSLLNEIETLFDERHEQAEEGGEVVTGHHMMLSYRDKSLIDDASNLIIHHVKRQTAIHKEDKAKIKQLVRHFVPDLLFHPKMELSDDEKDLEDDDDHDDDEDDASDGGLTIGGLNEVSKEHKEGSRSAPASASAPNPNSSINTNTGGDCPSNDNNSNSNSNSLKRKMRSNKDNKDECVINVSGVKIKDEVAVGADCPPSDNPNHGATLNGEASEAEKSAAIKTDSVKSEPQSPEAPKIPSFSTSCSTLSDDEYRLFMCNNNWYLFLRLHQILCSRLTIMYEHSVKIAAENTKERKERKESAAAALRLKPKSELPAEDYYPALLDMVTNVLDGNLECLTYEDSLREMFGIHAYTAFTLDKVVNGAVRQLQHIVCDEIPCQCTTTFLHEAKKGGAGGPLASSHRRLTFENSYQKRAEKLLQEENCYKICSYKRDCRITVELVDTECDETEENGNSNNGTPMPPIRANEDAVGGLNDPDGKEPEVASVSSPLSCLVPAAVSEAEKWSEYVEKYVSSVSPQVTPAMQAQLSKKPVFLPRNLRSGRKVSHKQATGVDGLSRKDDRCGMQAIDMVDNTQCKFNIANYNMVFVVNSDSFMYKKQALLRARQSHEVVSKTMRRGFTKWHSQWGERNLSEEDINISTSWFMGESEGLQPNKTKIKIIDNKTKPPFGPYNKYVCEILTSGNT